MVEVLVSTATGIVVLAGLTMVIVVDDAQQRAGSAPGSTRPSRARLVITKIMEQLHSACVAPKIAADPGDQLRARC